MNRVLMSAVLLLAALTGPVRGQDLLRFDSVQVLTNREVLVQLSGPLGAAVRIESSADLATWTGLATVVSSGATHVDSAAPLLSNRSYRALTLVSSNVVTGDHVGATDGEITLHPVNHASLVLLLNNTAIFCDPVGGAARYQGLPRADLILVTHAHGDHNDAGTINAVKGPNATILAPAVVHDALPSSLKAITTVLTNGATVSLLNLSVEAVPAYNLTTANHPKGIGNGYILTIGDQRVYISGDTEDTPELRTLPNIDVAFVCMNLPYTMSVEKAASAVREFQPKVVYPYHYSGYSAADIDRFKRLVGADLGIEVRLRKWY